jgi:hypothetical protein
MVVETVGKDNTFAHTPLNIDTHRFLAYLLASSDDLASSASSAWVPSACWILAVRPHSDAESRNKKEQKPNMDPPTLPPATPPTPGSVREVQALARELYAADTAAPLRTLADILSDIRKTINQDHARTAPAANDPAAPAANDLTSITKDITNDPIMNDLISAITNDPAKISSDDEEAHILCYFSDDEDDDDAEAEARADVEDEKESEADETSDHRTLQEELFAIGNVFIDTMMLPADEAIALKLKHTQRHNAYLALETRLGCEAIQLDQLELQKAKKSASRKACEHLAFAGLMLTVGTFSTVVTAVVALRLIGF